MALQRATAGPQCKRLCKTASLTNRVAAPAMPVSSTPGEGSEMGRSFDTPHQEADAPSKPRIVLRDDRRGLLNEHLEARTLWVAARRTRDVEARILELRRISGGTRSEDLRATIDGAIEDCVLRLAELRSQDVSPSAA